jgi:hypothetical protein
MLQSQEENDNKRSHKFINDQAETTFWLWWEHNHRARERGRWTLTMFLTDLTIPRGGDDSELSPVALTTTETQFCLSAEHNYRDSRTKVQASTP